MEWYWKRAAWDIIFFLDPVTQYILNGHRSLRTSLGLEWLNNQNFGKFCFTFEHEHLRAPVEVFARMFFFI